MSTHQTLDDAAKAHLSASKLAAFAEEKRMHANIALVKMLQANDDFKNVGVAKLAELERDYETQHGNAKFAESLAAAALAKALAASDALVCN